MAKPKKIDQLEQENADLTADLKRLRADFENYRKRADSEKQQARADGEIRAVVKFLPAVDTIDRAVANIPSDISSHQWVKGVSGLVKQLDKMMSEFNLKKIDARAGVEFNPELHQAIQFDEDATGDKEVIAEELQSGYTLNDTPIRHSMVKVTRQ